MPTTPREPIGLRSPVIFPADTTLTQRSNQSSAKRSFVKLMDTSPPLPPSNVVWTMMVGTLVANAIGGCLLFAVTWFVSAYREHDFSALVAWPSFFVIPFFVGLTAAWFWRRIHRSIAWSTLDAVFLMLVG